MSGATLHCEHCCLTLTSMDQYNQHLAGKKHLKKLKALGLSENPSIISNPDKAHAGQFKTSMAGPPSDPIAQGPLGSGGPDPVMAAVKANMMGNIPTKKEQYSGRCDLCNVDYTSASHEEQHLAGQKHAKKVTLASGGTNVATFFCSFCNVTVNSPQQMDQHRLGTVHQKKVEKRKAEQAGDSPSPAKKMFVPSTETPIVGNNLAQPPPPPPHQKLSQMY